MSRAAVSVFVFGIYLYVVGALLVAVPNHFLRLSLMPPTSEVWIRVVGVLVLCIATYYTLAARAGMREFLRWTVAVRAAVMVFFSAFVLLRLAAPPLALFGVVDFAGAVWTALALRADGRGSAVRAGR
jgi:hypothetical protein